ncbi:MT-A70 family methyltransferase [Methylosinus sp. Sm6]|uniref:MT-A70 family methyltransferase n=1 Tax=Methylosinus sp. Sm6 TaxID=2866948 RepID=UPI00351D5F1C
MSEPWPFGALPPKSYDLILADPPWEYEIYSSAGKAKTPLAQYRCMPLTEIAALDVGRLARRHAWLLLWSTAPHLADALYVMRSWGFGYRSRVNWRKVFASGAPAIGLGYLVRSQDETLLIGAIGKPSSGQSFVSPFDGVRREHSRKPEELYPLIDAFAPGARRCELFARTRRPGWDYALSDELDKFEAGA